MSLSPDEARALHDEVCVIDHDADGLSLRAALPLMHFRPAETLGRRVGQMVQQEFNFRLAMPDSATAAPIRTP